MTREDVRKWITAYKRLKADISIRDYFAQRISKLGLDDEDVNTIGHDSLPDTTHLADLLVMDLPSYDNVPSDY